MSRYYKYNGLELPSVTTITGQLDKPALMPWAANCAIDYLIEDIDNNVDHRFDIGLEWVTLSSVHITAESARKNYRTVSRKALDIGSRVHGAIEDYLNIGKEPYNPSDEVLSAFLAFLEWFDENNVQPIQAEKTVYGEKYAGTCDLVCLLDGEKYLIDFKSSKGIYPEMRYQVAGYRQTDESIKGCGILRLDKITGLPEWKDTSSTYEDDRRVFNILVDLWWATHPRKRAQFEKIKEAA